MTKSKIFLGACLFFIFGIFLGAVFTLDFKLIYLAIFLSFAVGLLGIWKRYFFIFGLFALVIFLGILRYQLSLPAITSDKIYFYNGQKVEMAGLIDKEPDQRSGTTKYEIAVSQLFQNNAWQKISGKVLVTDYLYPEYKYGDYLQISCKLQAPENIDGFAYDNYLSRYGIYSVCYYPKISVLANGKGNSFLADIYWFKGYFVSRLNRILPEPHSSFLAGLLIGAKKSIPADLQTAFSKTGTTHIVAVSGYNITIIVTFIMLILNTLAVPRKKAFWLINAGLVIFILITGLQASILRAAIMGFLVLLANYLGRLNRVTNALVFAAAVMLVFNPKLLAYDMGFQLSFLATLGLIYFQPILSKIFRVENIKSKFWQAVLGDYLATTLAAIIMTTPIILFNFGKVSLAAPLANILVLPAVPLAMLLGFVAGVFGLFSITLGWLAGWLVWLVLTYIIWVLNTLSNLSWAYFEFPRISFWLMLFLFSLIIAFIYIFNKVEKRNSA